MKKSRTKLDGIYKYPKTGNVGWIQWAEESILRDSAKKIVENAAKSIELEAWVGKGVLGADQYGRVMVTAHLVCAREEIWKTDKDDKWVLIKSKYHLANRETFDQLATKTIREGDFRRGGHISLEYTTHPAFNDVILRVDIHNCETNDVSQHNKAFKFEELPSLDFKSKEMSLFAINFVKAELDDNEKLLRVCNV